MDETIFTCDEGTPTAGADGFAEPQQANSGLEKSINSINAKVDLVLKALGVSAANVEGGDSVEVK